MTDRWRRLYLWLQVYLPEILLVMVAWMATSIWSLWMMYGDLQDVSRESREKDALILKAIEVSEETNCILEMAVQHLQRLQGEPVDPTSERCDEGQK